MKVTVNMQQAEKAFVGFINQAAKLTGLDPRKIVLSEAGSILKNCAERTKVASDAKVRQGAILRALRGQGLTGGNSSAPVTINAGLRGPYGRVFARTASGGYRRTHEAGFRALNQHYASSQWAQIQAGVASGRAAIASALPQARATAGLARKSWVQIADSLGINLAQVPGGRLAASSFDKARQAQAKGGRDSQNGQSRVAADPNKYFVTLINALPYGNRLGFNRLLTLAVAGRINYFKQAVSHGFSGSFQQAAKSFPGWTVKEAA